MDLHDRERRVALLAGGALVVFGIAILGVQQSDLDIGWPAWLGPALILITIYLAVLAAFWLNTYLRIWRS